MRTPFVPLFLILLFLVSVFMAASPSPAAAGAIDGSSIQGAGPKNGQDQEEAGGGPPEQPAESSSGNSGNAGSNAGAAGGGSQGGQGGGNDGEMAVSVANPGNADGDDKPRKHRRPRGWISVAAADLDGDGLVTLADLRILGRDLNTLAAVYRGDVTGDNKIDIGDLRTLAGVILRAAAPEEKLAGADLDAFIREVVEGGYDGRDDDGNPARAADTKGAGRSAAAAERPGRFSDLIGTIDARRASLRVKDLQKTADRTASLDERLDELKKLLAGAGAEAAEAEGEPPAYPEELNQYVARLEAKVRGASVKPAFGDLVAARNRKVGRSLERMKIDDIFRSALDLEVSKIPLSECPDPTLVGAPAASSGIANLRIRSSNLPPEKRDIVAKSKFNIVFNPDDRGAMKVISKKNGESEPLADEYRKVSPRAGARSDAFRALGLPGAVLEASEDPLVSQILGDADAAKFRRAADKNGDGTVSRSECLLFLFAPETLAAALGGDFAAIGLSPDSFLARNFGAVLQATVPVLQASGALGADQARILAQFYAQPKIAAAPADEAEEKDGDASTRKSSSSGTGSSSSSSASGLSRLASQSTKKKSGLSSSGSVGSLPVPVPLQPEPSIPTGGGGGGCFAAGTPILMADGSVKPIERVRPGELVMSFDGRGSLVPGRVARTFVHRGCPVLSAAGMTVTPEHRFLRPDGTFRAIGKLRARDRLVRADGTLVRLGRVRAEKVRRIVYNFEVEGTHTYVAGGFRVHNMKANIR